jgi:hypothetical protein
MLKLKTPFSTVAFLSEFSCKNLVKMLRLLGLLVIKINKKKLGNIFENLAHCGTSENLAINLLF